jgi:hypothetical protein
MRFSQDERRILLATPGIGSRVIERLESIGIHSFALLRHGGLDSAVNTVCASMGSRAWANRARALRRALDVHLRTAQASMATTAKASVGMPLQSGVQTVSAGDCR